MQLRDYQLAAIDEIRAEYRAGHRAVCFQLSTGGGKTLTAGSMIRMAADKGRRCLVLAHRIELVAQLSGTLRQLGVDHGLLLRGCDITQHPVQVGMIQTVANRIKRIATPDFITVDECHHAVSSSYLKILSAFPDARILGLTATPQRLDGRGLGEVFSAMVRGPSMSDLIAGGSLSPYRVFCPAAGQISVSGIAIRAGDYAQDQLADAADRPTITGDAIEHYRRYADGQKFIAFCVSVAHAQHVAEAFSAAGIAGVAVYGDMDPPARVSAMERFRSGAIRGLVSCNLISEGVDVPDATAAILLRPTQSLTLYLQAVGRVLRPSPGKVAVILDHAGNAFRHGLPDQDREWSLDAKKRRKKRDEDPKLPIRHCQECFSVYNAALAACPYCGAVAVVKRSPPQHVDGQLVEVDAARWRQGRMIERLADCKTISDLIAMQQSRGYKRGWVLHSAQHHLGMSLAEAAQALGYKPGFVYHARKHQKGKIDGNATAEV